MLTVSSLEVIWYCNRQASFTVYPLFDVRKNIERTRFGDALFLLELVVKWY